VKRSDGKDTIALDAAVRNLCAPFQAGRLTGDLCHTLPQRVVHLPEFLSVLPHLKQAMANLSDDVANRSGAFYCSMGKI
jgi:hypothetical protein